VVPPVDVDYSEFLSVLGGRYRIVAGTEPSATVGVVQIFTGAGQRNFTDVAEITRGELLLESRDRNVIDRLISAMQLHETSTDASCRLDIEAAWILVAYDAALFRAGVIRLYECGQDTETIVGIRPVGDTAITYSREAGATLRSLGLIGASPLKTMRE
jgi:hypothetical protein